VGGARKATLDVFVGSSAPMDVAVDVVRASDGGQVAHFVLAAMAGGAVQSVEWDGLAGGLPQPEGRYAFRVSVPAATLRAAEAPTPTSEVGSFVLLRHQFPVAGLHDYGGAAGLFGAGRGGRSHQGQDVFARCGTPMVAARGGTVKHVAFHALAGHYVVIAGADSQYDYVYMHLQSGPLMRKGDTVATGQPIGLVGDTGDAHGCHLHFELWSAPGWYSGGRPVDPLAELKNWDTAA
jgi:murein DD-endopeptidase MepM/ murein hydrolase activator NlpD